MSKTRTFQLDELTLRPGTYFNPQTEIMVVVDDSPEVDHEIFETDEFDGVEWVLIADDAPVDEHKRDQLVERFQLTHQPAGEPSPDEDDLDDDEDDLDEGEDELEGLDELELDREHEPEHE